MNDPCKEVRIPADEVILAPLKQSERKVYMTGFAIRESPALRDLELKRAARELGYELICALEDHHRKPVLLMLENYSELAEDGGICGDDREYILRAYLYDVQTPRVETVVEALKEASE